MSIVNDIKIKIKLLFNYKLPGKFTKVRSSDIYIVSYPKSGNTWMRFLFGNVLFEGNFDFTNMNDKIPDIYHKSKSFIDKLTSPRVIKSHEQFNNSLISAKVIYIYRDPRDVVVSYYYWYKKFSPKNAKSFDSFFEKFIKGKLTYGLWSQHVSAWKKAATKHPESVYVIKYEDLKDNPFVHFKNILKFCNINVNSETIHKAIDRSSFNSMKKKEEEQEKNSLFKDTDTTIKFVRSGKSEWHELLNQSQIQSMEKVFGVYFNEFKLKT